MTSFRRWESCCSSGESWRRKCATNHLILALCGSASKLTWVVASGGDEVSASRVEWAEVTSWTEPMSASGSRRSLLGTVILSED